MRIRLRFTKVGKVRFLGHRDVARIWERVIRRAGLPIAYSEGFSPRPRLHFGLALSTGHESTAEYLDIDLRDEVDVEGLPALLSPLLPEGIDVVGALHIADHADSLQEEVLSCAWTFELIDVTPAELASVVASTLALETIPVTIERKGKPISEDVRPVIMAMSVGDETPDGVELRCELSTKPRSIRPAELLAALDPPQVERRVRRDEQWMTIDGVRRPPVPADLSPRPAAVRQAS